MRLCGCRLAACRWRNSTLEECIKIHWFYRGRSNALQGHLNSTSAPPTIPRRVVEILCLGGRKINDQRLCCRLCFVDLDVALHFRKCAPALLISRNPLSPYEVEAVIIGGYSKTSASVIIQKLSFPTFCWR